jgi:phosphate/sulfate permease
LEKATSKQQKQQTNNNMKKLLTLAALVGATTVSFAQGTVNFQNASATLTSAGGVAAPISTLFNYALFFAPEPTAGSVGQSASLTDPAFQNADSYTTSSLTSAGRLVSRASLATQQPAGSTLDFVVRGWSANAGATWQEALAFWNNGAPAQDMFIGSSLIGNNIILGGGITPPTTLFGFGANQVAGFNMALVPGTIVPEPTSMVLAGLGAASLLLFRRRK